MTSRPTPPDGDRAVRAAIAELRSIRSNDPSAAIARTTIKATIHTLETHWLGSGAAGRVRTDRPGADPQR